MARSLDRSLFPVQARLDPQVGHGDETRLAARIYRLRNAYRVVPFVTWHETIMQIPRPPATYALSCLDITSTDRLPTHRFAQGLDEADEGGAGRTSQSDPCHTRRVAMTHSAEKLLGRGSPALGADIERAGARRFAPDTPHSPATITWLLGRE